MPRQKRSQGGTLASHKARINAHIDLLIHDLGAPLRRSFAIFGHGLLKAKEAQITALFNWLFPAGSFPGTDIQTLVHESDPVTKVRQIANWTNSVPAKNPDEELAQLQLLPRKWLAALAALESDAARSTGNIMV
jgi:hypothetical protein